MNVYDDPAYAKVAGERKAHLAERRRQIGDDGKDYPEVEAVVQELWADNASARAKAEQISHDDRALIDPGGWSLLLASGCY